MSTEQAFDFNKYETLTLDTPMNELSDILPKTVSNLYKVTDLSNLQEGELYMIVPQTKENVYTGYLGTLDAHTVWTNNFHFMHLSNCVSRYSNAALDMDMYWFSVNKERPVTMECNIYWVRKTYHNRKSFLEWVAGTNTNTNTNTDPIVNYLTNPELMREVCSFI